jgi:hypothetical protein
LSAIQNTMQMTALLPLLSNQSVSVTADTPGLPFGLTLVGQTLEMQPTNTILTLLPLLMMSGGLGGSSGGSDNSNNMLLMLALAGVL